MKLISDIIRPPEGNELEGLKGRPCYRDGSRLEGKVHSYSRQHGESQSGTDSEGLASSGQVCKAGRGRGVETSAQERRYDLLDGNIVTSSEGVGEAEDSWFPYLVCVEMAQGHPGRIPWGTVTGPVGARSIHWTTSGRPSCNGHNGLGKQWDWSTRPRLA